MSSTPPPTQRESFLDLARVVALLGMIGTHTTNALLASAYKDSEAYHAWRFVTGLVAVMFLVLAGFLFARGVQRGAPTARWPWARTFRYGSYIALGYVLHWPVRDWLSWVHVSDAAWQKFIQVDILQLLGVGLIGLQLVYRAAGRRAHFTKACLAAAIAVAVATPMVASIAWTSWLPDALASYVWQGSGALFPAFPWLAYLLAGAALASWSPVANGTSGMRARALFLSGLILVTAGVAGDRYGPTWLAQPDFWRTSPLLVAIRLGCVLGLLAITALVPRLPDPGARAIRVFAEQSLLVYVLHVVLIYGSVFSFGLRRYFGATLSPLAVAAITLGLTLLCWLAAWAKHRVDASGRPGQPTRSLATA
jgi:surface polysaccharide O-acyltransferase-like enzyme